MNREQMLMEALETVTKLRQSSYGTPEDNFGSVAKAWSAYFAARGYILELVPADVAAMMVMLKVVRAGNKLDYADNWLDMAGYAACGCEVATKEAQT